MVGLDRTIPREAHAFSAANLDKSDVAYIFATTGTETLMNARAACNVVLFLALVTVTGCTRSLEMTYNPAAYRLAQGDQLRSVAIGIAKFEDRRSWIDRTEPKSLAYVMQGGQWKFGLTYQGKEYIPVQDLVQMISVDEFRSSRSQVPRHAPRGAASHRVRESAGADR